MSELYPQGVVNKILQITLGTQIFAYLAVDDDGVLCAVGGDLTRLNLPSWEIGESVLDDALFLHGLIPAQNPFQTLPALALDENTLVDVHLFRDQQLNWVILVDQTEQLEWQSRARQKANELHLVEAKLKRLEANETGFEFFNALNMLALEQYDDQRFVLLRPVPIGFHELYPESLYDSEYLEPQKHFPFLENFLIDARALWAQADNSNRIYSGPWIEQGEDDNEIALEASALNWQGHRLMFIEILDDHYREHHEFLQIGRESHLLKGYLEEEVRQRTRDIREREEEIALRLVCAADTRDDGETGSHIRRLGLYSELIARHLGWSDDQIDEIRIAATMHDIGKIGIPDHILKKPAKLEAPEFEIMKTHPLIGARILSNSKASLVQMAREIAIGHHEKWDGSGYPYQLKGEDIPISARIVAIVDVFDALIHKRVYKDEIRVEQALDIMREGRGSHFDPNLFDLFYSLREDMERIASDFFDPLCQDIDTLRDKPGGPGGK